MDLHMLTTTDNPWSPVTDYDAWLAWDTRAGYHTNSLLARNVFTSPDLSDVDNALAIEDGINVIVGENLSGVHTRVFLGTLDTSGFESSSDGSSTGNRAA